MTVKTTDYDQEESAAYIRRNQIHNEYFDLWRHQTDYVDTWYGIVFVSRYYNEDLESTTMSFVWQGRDYTRFWKRFWGDKTITRLAREMVNEVVGK